MYLSGIADTTIKRGMYPDEVLDEMENTCHTIWDKFGAEGVPVGYLIIDAVDDFGVWFTGKLFGPDNLPTNEMAAEGLLPITARYTNRYAKGDDPRAKDTQPISITGLSFKMDPHELKLGKAQYQTSAVEMDVSRAKATKD